MNPLHCPLAALLICLACGCGGLSGSSANQKDTPGQTAPPPAPAAAPGGSSLSSDFLAAHNHWRRAVGVPALTWSSELATYAQTWANTLQTRGCDLQHRSDSPYGENLAWSTGPSLPPERVVAMWTDERADYDPARNACRSGKICGHYTQVVWKNTKAVGCGGARCGDAEVWVCNYDPPGNWEGERPY